MINEGYTIEVDGRKRSVESFLSATAAKRKTESVKCRAITREGDDECTYCTLGLESSRRVNWLNYLG